jgi:hypothetical protein
MNRYTVFSLLLALMPFLAICVMVPLCDRIDPLILGLPFNLAWLIAWIPLTSLCMAGVYQLWKRSQREALASDEVVLPTTQSESSVEGSLQ